jgi:hypothetical protein
MAIKCGKTLGKEDAWIFALDAMVNVGDGARMWMTLLKGQLDCFINMGAKES